MAIRNDSISSMRNNSALRLVGYWHPNMSTPGAEALAHSKVDEPSKDGFMTEGINANISSVRMQ